MIEKFYTRHIKNSLDASQINVMRVRKRREREETPNRRASVPGRTQARRVRNSRSSGATRKSEAGK
jgi:hypothetical protein